MTRYVIVAQLHPEASHQVLFGAWATRESAQEQLDRWNLRASRTGGTRIKMSVELQCEKSTATFEEVFERETGVKLYGAPLGKRSPGGSVLGGLLAAARRRGLSLDEYEAKLAAGEKWCTRCAEWHPVSAFPRDRTRGDGLKASCLASHRGANRPPTVRNQVREEARSMVNRAVRAGSLPRANTLPCTDCGHIWAEGERRHEYDHFKGYEPQHHLDVQPVCTTCHADREIQRKLTHGSDTCWPKTTAQPFDGWRATTHVETVLAARQAADEALEAALEA